MKSKKTKELPVTICPLRKPEARHHNKHEWVNDENGKCFCEICNITEDEWAKKMKAKGYSDEYLATH